MRVRPSVLSASVVSLLTFMAIIPGRQVAAGPRTSHAIDEAGSGESSDQAPPGGFNGDPATTERIETSDPTTAAVQTSQARFHDDMAAHVVLSRDDDFPDSLAGAALTGEGPLLLTATAVLTPTTAVEIDRVLPAGGRVYLLGGGAAITPAVEGQLQASGYQTVRLAGPSRVETSVQVTEEVRRLYPGNLTVALARSQSSPDNPTAAWADSVTGGAWAAATATPIMVTPSTGVHPEVGAALSRYQPTTTVLLGGSAALSADVEQQVPYPRRIEGVERSTTAVAIAVELWQPPPGRWTIINAYRSDGWAFGLPAAGLAADFGAPLLLSDVDRVPEAT